LKGKITRIRSSGAYDVLFNDGELEKRVDSTFIRLDRNQDVQSDDESGLDEGHQVQVKGQIGEIIRKRSDSTYDILYENGEVDKRVPQRRITNLQQRRQSKSKHSNSDDDSDYEESRSIIIKFQVGEKVKANYRGAGVQWQRIKSLEPKASGIGGRSFTHETVGKEKLAVGTLVDAWCFEQSRFLPGYVEWACLDGQYSIRFEDGRLVHKVPKNGIVLYSDSSSHSGTGSTRRHTSGRKC
jgi:hypothetical protein